VKKTLRILRATVSFLVAGASQVPRTERGVSPAFPPQATAWLEGWGQTWSLPQLTNVTRVEVGVRLRSSLGRCQPSSGLIRIHPTLLGDTKGAKGDARNEPDESLLKEVLCHEAAHVGVYLLHGASVRPHGPEWARLMRAAGYEPRARVDPNILPASFRTASRPKRLYQHRCPVCGASRIARRAVHRWRCRVCVEAGLPGRLEISTRPPADR
jgi:predicted SprT family Zn-dependent metalloprotease